MARRLESFNTLTEAAQILMPANPTMSRKEILLLLEDGESPTTRKFQEDLYNQVLSKNHIDFDDIPTSKGDVKKYKGYESMRDCLAIMKNIAGPKDVEVTSLVEVVGTALDNLLALAPLYKKGFSAKNDMVILEYNTYVYTCVQAVTTLLFVYVDFVKRPDQLTMQPVIKNTKYRPDLFYITQLQKFNAVNKKGDYKTYLSTLVSSGKENFIGLTTVVGFATISAVVLSIVPITRELIFQFENTKRKVSDYLAVQAYCIEMNQMCLEGRSDIDAKKKASILKKQEKIRLSMLRLADICRVDNAKAREKSQRDLRDVDRTMSVENLQKEVEASPLQLL